MPEEYTVKWQSIVSQLESSFKIPIPRWLGFRSFLDISLHCFTDASEKALGVVIYLVQKNTSRFYTSKSKICPIKSAHFTIPRKELTSISLGARYIKFVFNAISKYFTPKSIHLWSDSTTALIWCLSKVPHKELYVRSRVDDLAKKVQDYNIVMHHVISESNPADLLTKDTGKDINDPLWTNGPKILQNPEQWNPFNVTRNRIDTVPIFCGFVPSSQYKDLPDPDKFEKLIDLHRHTAKSQFQIQEDQIDVNLVKAENLWIKKVQYNHYPNVIKFLNQMGNKKLRGVEGKQTIRKLKLDPPQLCLNLHLFLDNESIIRVNTSVSNCPNLSTDQINPILLPPVDPYSKLIIRDCHVKAGHMGLYYTNSLLRNKYWITKPTTVIKEIIKMCQVCCIQRGQRYHVADSPPLPTFRFDVKHPWYTTAVDMTGNMVTRERGSDKDEKVYLLIFVCLSTGSGHVEMVQDATSESFAEGIERFMHRRGVPKLFISDQGSNFKGYNTELKKYSDQMTCMNSFKDNGIKWKWTPISGPHFNGYCERHLGLIKTIIKKSIGNKILSKSQLNTVATYAESIFNERPLQVLAGSDPDFIPVTPNVLVYGRSLRQFSHDLVEIDWNDPNFKLNNKDLSVMAKKLRSTLARVRKLWIQDYCNFLSTKDTIRQKMSPHNKSLILPQVGHYVLIKDDSSNDLRIGKITKINPSEDLEVRSVQVKTKFSEGVFPVCKLRYLEGYKGDNTLEGNPDNDNPSSTPGGKRPARKAKTDANRKLISDNNTKLVCLFLSNSAQERYFLGF